jgi:hypothetical protein
MAYVVEPPKAKSKNPVPKMPVLLHGDDLYLSELERMEKDGSTFILCHQALDENGDVVTQMFPWTEFRGHEFYDEMSADKTTKKTKKNQKKQSSAPSASSSNSSNFVVSSAKSSSSGGKNAKRT